MSKSNVSNHGLSHLCGVSTDGSIVATDCNRLESFFARNTKVTHFGICLAMTILKHLKFVDHKSLQVANEELSANVLPPKMILKLCSFGNYEFLKLQFKVIQSTEIPSDFHHQFIGYSKYVKSISLASVKDNGTYLERLPSRFYLPCPSREISYVNGVAPFLADYGQDLQAIRWHYVGKVDIFSVLALCPRLTSMVLRSENYFQSAPCPTIAPQHLEHLKFSSGGDNLKKDELLHLLLSPNLKVIDISLCAVLCDDVRKRSGITDFENWKSLSSSVATTFRKQCFLPFFFPSPMLFTSSNSGTVLHWLRRRIESLAASRNWHLNIAA